MIGAQRRVAILNALRRGTVPHEGLAAFAVGMERFIKKLKAIGFKGPLNIEREVPDPAQRLRDLALGVKLLEKLRG